MLHLLRVAGFTLPIASLTVALLVTAQAAGQASQDAPSRQATGTEICVHSDTYYMKTPTMEEALRRQPEFHDLNLNLTEDRTKSELYIEIKRSLITWEWSYTVVATHTGRRVGSGKLRAVTADGAANTLGPLIMRSITAALRAPAPASPAAPAPAVAATPARPAVGDVPDTAALERELRAASITIENLDVPRANGATNPHAYALIFGAENYRAPIPQVPFALNDAAVMRRYFERTLGVSADKLRGVPNPALTDMKVGLMWLRNQMLADGSPNAVAYVYYAGHGVPEVKSGKPYLMPVDANPDYIAETGYALDTLVTELSRLPGHSVVFLDACFTGAAARGSGSSAGVTLGKRPAFVDVAPVAAAPARVSVFSAVTGHQTSNALPAAYHGLFTYYLLKGLRGAAADAQGRITLDSLQSYVSKEVSITAERLNQTQTPTLSGPAELVLMPKTTPPPG